MTMPDIQPLVSVQIVVRNGERFIRHCLDSVRAQIYMSTEVVVLDNNSDDSTANIIASEYPEFRLIRRDNNLGMWPGQEMLLSHTRGLYVLVLSVDVILDPQFIANAVAACERDITIAAVQGKIFQYSLPQLETDNLKLTTAVIDTCGFGMTRSRKVLNIGHGQPDGPYCASTHDIFGVEGAAPFFRRSALEDCRVEGKLIDTDYFWYGDDLDLAWRMTLFGHRQVFVPGAVAWHDRSTTKGAATSLAGHLARLRVRRAIPLRKRRLDWSNVRFTIIKNDYILNLLRDAPWILAREMATLLYALAIEPGILLEAGRFFALLPRMLKRRHAIMRRAVISARTMHQWFT
ncbi:MAG: glycosyltransferase [Patescibacteria group bacterium]